MTEEIKRKRDKLAEEHEINSGDIFQEDVFKAGFDAGEKIGRQAERERLAGAMSAPSRDAMMGAFNKFTHRGDSDFDCFKAGVEWRDEKLSASLAAKDLRIKELEEYEWKYKELCR